MGTGPESEPPVLRPRTTWGWIVRVGMVVVAAIIVLGFVGGWMGR